MRHANEAIFSTEKVKSFCKETNQQFTAEIEADCKRLEGRRGIYNRWQALIFDREGYDIINENGKAEFVPAVFCNELW